MAKPYKMVKEEQEYKIIEIETEQCILKSKEEPFVKKYLKNLNFGYGFRGFTPSFFLFDYK